MFGHKKLTCSFCGRDESDVAKLVAGPSVYICDECVALASRIMKESGEPPRAEARRGVVRAFVQRVRGAWPFIGGKSPKSSAATV